MAGRFSGAATMPSTTERFRLCMVNMGVGAIWRPDGFQWADKRILARLRASDEDRSGRAVPPKRGPAPESWDDRDSRQDGDHVALITLAAVLSGEWAGIPKWNRIADTRRYAFWRLKILTRADFIFRQRH